MKRILIGFAALLGLVATASGQLVPFPQSLPPSTVVGRTGISAGPAQAIPFSVLTTLLTGTGSGIFGLKLSGDTDYAMVSTDRTVLINAGLTAPRTVTLPTAASIATGQQICIADAFGGVTSTNTLTIARSSADTINGATSFVIGGAFGGYCLISDGFSKWTIGLIQTATLGNNVVSNAKLAQMAAKTIKGNNTAGTANALDLTATQANAVINCASPGGSGTAIIYATCFGVLPDNSTDNTTALQAAVTACASVNATANSDGGILVLPAGVIIINGTMTSNSPCVIHGAGPGGGFSATDFGGTAIQQNTLAADTFIFNTLHGVTMRDFAIQYGNGSQGTGNGILIRPAVSPGSNPNRGSHIENVRIWGGNVGINCQNCGEFYFGHNQIRDFANQGIYVPHNSSLVDYGDSLIVGNIIWDFNVTTASAGILLDPAAAVQIIGNKIIGGQVGLQLNVSQGPTATLSVFGNSIEQQSVNQIRITQGAAGKTFGNISIVGNELSSLSVTGFQGNIAVAAGAAQYITGMVIGSNVTNNGGGTNPIGINLGDGGQVIVHHNIINMGNAAGSIGLATSGNATGIQMQDNNINNTVTRYSFSVSTQLVDHQGTTFATIPTTNVANGSQLFISDGAPASTPCTGASTGSTAFRQNGAWKCF